MKERRQDGRKKKNKINIVAGTFWSPNHLLFVDKQKWAKSILCLLFFFLFSFGNIQQTNKRRTQIQKQNSILFKSVGIDFHRIQFGHYNNNYFVTSARNITKKMFSKSELFFVVFVCPFKYAYNIKLKIYQYIQNQMHCIL